MKGILIGDPAGVYRAHVDAMFCHLGCAGPGHHVEGCLGHVGVRVVGALEVAVEHALHARHVDHPGWTATTHDCPQLAGDVEGHSGIDDLGAHAVK